jgi:hypothetical protein
MTLQKDSQAKVVVEKNMTENFNADVGVTQGNALSLISFRAGYIKKK